MIKLNEWVHTLSIALAAGLLLAVTACSVQVDPSKGGGKDKNIKIQTLFGGVQVKTDNLAASDVGLPSYPGATAISNSDKSGAADVQVGFGNWQMRLKVVKYHTADGKEQVLAFYRKALGRYGDVIQCEAGNAVGSPTVTHQGLGCGDQESGMHAHTMSGMDRNSELKSGSKKHQHLVSIDKAGSDGTDFSMVILDLPADDVMNGNDEHRESN